MASLVPLSVGPTKKDEECLTCPIVTIEMRDKVAKLSLNQFRLLCTEGDVFEYLTKGHPSMQMPETMSLKDLSVTAFDLYHLVTALKSGSLGENTKLVPHTAEILGGFPLIDRLCLKESSQRHYKEAHYKEAHPLDLSQDVKNQFHWKLVYVHLTRYDERQVIFHRLQEDGYEVTNRTQFNSPHSDIVEVTLRKPKPQYSND